jgi:hypothetical protein
MRKIEIFSAGCGLCDDAVVAVKAVACPSCGVEVRDMSDPAVIEDARRYGIQRVPAVVIDGRLADCCATGTIDIGVLRSLGLGQP